MARSFAAMNAPRTTNIPKRRGELTPTHLGGRVAVTEPAVPGPSTHNPPFERETPADKTGCSSPRSRTLDVRRRRAPEWS
jgi:hypothetical protein